MLKLDRRKNISYWNTAVELQRWCRNELLSSEKKELNCLQTLFSAHISSNILYNTNVEFPDIHLMYEQHNLNRVAAQKYMKILSGGNLFNHPTLELLHWSWAWVENVIFRGGDTDSRRYFRFPVAEEAVLFMDEYSYSTNLCAVGRSVIVSAFLVNGMHVVKLQSHTQKKKNIYCLYIEVMGNHFLIP